MNGKDPPKSVEIKLLSLYLHWTFPRKLEIPEWRHCVQVGKAKSKGEVINLFRRVYILETENPIQLYSPSHWTLVTIYSA